MIEPVEQLKEERPDLVKFFENMSHKRLLEQIYLECMDGINMEERVQTFMTECTDLSKTTYPPHVIKSLVEEKYRRDISDFCEMALENIEGMDLEEVKQYLKEELI